MTTNDQAAFPTRRIWLVAILTAVCIGAPISVFVKHSPWLISIPIIFGVVVLMAFQIVHELRSPSFQELPLVKSSGDLFGLTKYKGHVALSFPIEKVVNDQETFAFLDIPRKKAPKNARIIRDPDTGEKIYLIDTERFISLLLSRVSDNTDKLTECSILHALQRYGEMHGISSDLEKFLRSKTTLEVIKSDFRGNAAHTINNSSEAAIRDAIKHLTQPKHKELEIGT
jgi:hypothetical protein